MEEQLVNEKVCPLCSGRGLVALYKGKTKEYRIKTAQRLRDEGLVIRDIAKMMGYRSPRSVQRLLEKYNI